jgi:hypothetical protein
MFAWRYVVPIYAVSTALVAIYAILLIVRDRKLRRPRRHRTHYDTAA